MTLTLQIFSDVICPWCFIGKRRLERALDELDLRATAEITWLPFELNPDMPEGGMARADYRARKFGRERSETLDREMTERGRDEGIAFAFDRVTRTPSTRKAHRLIMQANRAGRGDAVKEALLAAYFEQALDVGDDDVLLDLATRHGLERADAAAAIRDPALDREVAALERRAAEIGVSGVPFFVLDGRSAVRARSLRRIGSTCCASAPASRITQQRRPERRGHRRGRSSRSFAVRRVAAWKPSGLRRTQERKRARSGSARRLSRSDNRRARSASL